MIQCQQKIGFSALENDRIAEETSLEFLPEGEFRMGETRVAFSRRNGEADPDVMQCNFEIRGAVPKPGRFFLSWEIPGYQPDWFVFMPSACYDGNRFQMIKSPKYPPDFRPENALHPEIAVREIASLDGVFNRMITDASAPLIGIYAPEEKQTFFLALEERTSLGCSGAEISVTENGHLKIIISLPCARRQRYAGNSRKDAGPLIGSGISFGFQYKTNIIDTPDMAAFYRAFMEIRSQFPVQGPLKNRRSFSHTEEIIIEMMENVRWLDEYKFYTKTRGLQKLDIGWVSYMELAPLYARGGDPARRHVMEELDNIFRHGPLPSGFLLSEAVGENGRTVWESRKNPQDGCSLTRTQVEILFFSLKTFLLIRTLGGSIPSPWEDATAALTEALARVWKKYRQLGFILDIRKGTILIGGSFSGALAPAAFLLAADYFRNEEYRQIAEETGSLYAEEFNARGYTYGGPGDSAFAPDSESAFSLLESLVTLFEKTGRDPWLKQAEACAAYCASWVPAVKYAFDAGSAYDQLDIDCRGAVQANLQNQHGAPAPCICSANMLLRLFRYTGNRKYLDLLREIAHNCVQYISTKAHPIPMVSGKALPPGDASEKVMFQDYMGWKGFLPAYGSGGWTEIAVLLCITENPGIYCCPDQNLCVVLDHLEASLSGNRLTVKNILDYPVRVRLMAENGKAQKEVTDPLAWLHYRTIELAPFEMAVVDLQ